MVEPIFTDPYPRGATPTPPKLAVDRSYFPDSNRGAGDSDLWMPGAPSPMPEHSRGTQPRRGSQSQSRPPRRPLATNFHHSPLQPPPESSPYYSHSSSQYAQHAPHPGTGYAIPYTMAPQQPAHNEPHTPSPPFSYQHSPHGFQHDSNMMPHTNYQAILQAQAHAYQYRHHSPDANHYPTASPPPMSPISALPSVPQGSSQPGSYPGPSQFHSLHYQSSPGPPFYPPQSFTPYSAYPQHFSPAGEPDGQGVWWYVPHGAPTPSSYQGHYPVNLTPREEINPYSSMTTNSSSPSVSSQSPAGYNLGLNAGPVSEASVSPADKEKDKTAVRRSYHPNPPAQRSEWVMWAGNVPSDATEAEVLSFFRETDSSNSGSHGVMSVFLITRTNCAFVNFESEADLDRAIDKFNGQPLRPNDARCPRLLCRVRRKEDDLRAGVGGQRGMGMHMRWVRENKGKDRDFSEHSELSDADEMPSSSSDRYSVSDDGRPPLGTSSSSGSVSIASTNSSVLARHFPKRYFILKSLTQHDLDLSVEKGVWATQKHNEEILDQAYRTSKEIYLIFGVNKSGEFYGYAKMAGPVRRGEQPVPWAQRSSSGSAASPQSAISPVTGRGPVQSETIVEEPVSPGQRETSEVYFPARVVDKSPMPISTPDLLNASSRLPETRPQNVHAAASAPPEMTHPHHKITLPTPPLPSKHMSEAQGRKNDAFHLDESAPERATKSRSASIDSPTSAKTAPSTLHSVEEEPEKEERERERDLNWGDNFKVEWICTTRLPFYRTHHIRNPWNHDREVKVSRDGTELEPGVGQKLIDEWHTSQPEGEGPGPRQRHGGTSKSARPYGAGGSRS